MTICINDISKTYTGLELSPLGLGYSPDPEFTGKIMNGRDGNYYIVKDEIKHKKWEILDIDLNGECLEAVSISSVNDSNEIKEIESICNTSNNNLYLLNIGRYNNQQNNQYFLNIARLGIGNSQIWSKNVNFSDSSTFTVGEFASSIVLNVIGLRN